MIVMMENYPDPPSDEPRSILTVLDEAVTARASLLDPGHTNALRLFNGFSEGCPDLVVDLYGATTVLYDYSEDPERGEILERFAMKFIKKQLPWLRAGIVKVRNSPSDEERRGKLLFGDSPDRKVRENGIWYAIDLSMSRDASLYLDTRAVRGWRSRSLRMASDVWLRARASSRRPIRMRVMMTAVVSK